MNRGAQRRAGPRRRALLTLAGVLALAGLVAWWLAPSGAERGGVGVLKLAGAAPEAPSFHAAAADARPADPVELQPTAEAPTADTPDGADASAARRGTRQISGRVTRLSDGTPLANAIVSTDDVQGRGFFRVRQISLTFDADGALRVDDTPEPKGIETRTDEDGRFTLAGVPRAVDRIHVRSDDAWPVRSLPVELPPSDGDVTGLAIVFDSGFLLQGSVRDGHGRPLAGASVHVEPMEPTSTDAAGRFALRDVAPAAGTITVECSADLPLHLRDSRPVPVPPDSTRLATVELVLEGSGAIEGLVTDAQGAPVGSLVVKLVVKPTARHGELALDHLRAETGADGRYRIEHVPAGLWLVEAGGAGDSHRVALLKGLFRAGVLDASGTVSWTVDGPATRLAPRRIPSVPVREGEVTQLDIVLDAGATIEGRVTDVRGAPVANAVLAPVRRERWPAEPQAHPLVSDDGSRRVTTADGESVLATRGDPITADEDGRYRIEFVPDGELLLTATDPEQQLLPDARILRVAGADLRVDFVLAQGLAVSGRVTDASGAPLEGAAVSLLPVGAPALAEAIGVSTDAEGWFRASGLTDGPHAITLGHSGCIELHDTVQPGGPELTYVLKSALEVHVLVVDAQTGAPLPAFEVGEHHGGMIVSRGTEEHEGGLFSRDEPDDGPVTFTILAAGHLQSTVTVPHPSDTSPAAPAVIRLQPSP